MLYPETLAEAQRWVCWRLEADPKGGKPRKIPYDPKTGKRASSTNPETWSNLEAAIRAKEQYLFAGVGFVFTEDGGIVGVDIDHCIDGEGKLNDCAREITRRYPTYTEVSPSGTGLHLFYRGTMPGKGSRNSDSGVEMYGSARYFTMTGKQLGGSPAEIRDGKEALAWIHETYIAREIRKKGNPKPARKPARLTDEELMSKAQAAANGADFRALYNGDWAGKFGSQSEADLSLCCSLAFWSGKDADQMDRLFRRSGLFRPKWDEVHGSGGVTYGQKTIEAALERTEETYNPGSGSGGPAAGIRVSGGRYVRVSGENVYAITNFTAEPIEQLECENETQMTCDMITAGGERFRIVLMTSDFSAVQKFKSILNQRTIALSFTGTENDLENLKIYLAGLEWPVKRGVRASGLYARDGGWLYADRGGAFMADGLRVNDIVQVEKTAVIDSRVTGCRAASAEDMKRIGPRLMAYNEEPKTVTVLAWTAGCFVKEILRSAGIKYPHLYLIGEAGSGKSTTLERVVQPIFGVNRVVAAPQITAFTLMKEAASSNVFPQTLDEYKPSKIDKVRLSALSSHFRDSYDGHEGLRGRADQTQVSYELLAPLVIAGEEAPEEPSIRERGMELLFSKKDLKPAAAREAFGQIARETETLTRMGRLLLETALTLHTETVTGWHREAVKLFNPEMPARVINNLACCTVGLKLLGAAVKRLGLAWAEVFPIPPAVCAKWLEQGTQEFLLDGGTSNKTVVEQSLEIMDRMGLSSEECRFLDASHVAIHFKGIYDRFTRYIRENAITTETLQYGQFMKQLRKSEVYVDAKVIRMGSGELRRSVILDYEAIKQRCDVDGFLRSSMSWGGGIRDDTEGS